MAITIAYDDMQSTGGISNLDFKAENQFFFFMKQFYYEFIRYFINLFLWNYNNHLCYDEINKCN